MVDPNRGPRAAAAPLALPSDDLATRRAYLGDLHAPGHVAVPAGPADPRNGAGRVLPVRDLRVPPTRVREPERRLGSEGSRGRARLGALHPRFPRLASPVRPAHRPPPARGEPRDR